MILANIPRKSAWYIGSAIGLSLVCFLSYPIAVYPALIACEAWISEQETKTMVTNWKRVLQRLGVVVVTSLLAYFIPSFQMVVSFNILFLRRGLLDGTRLLHHLHRVLHPALPLLHMRILPPSPRPAGTIDLLFVILGVGVMAVATTTTVLSMKSSVCNKNATCLGSGNCRENGRSGGRSSKPLRWDSPSPGGPAAGSACTESRWCTLRQYVCGERQEKIPPRLTATTTKQRLGAVSCEVTLLVAVVASVHGISPFQTRSFSSQRNPTKDSNY